MTFEEIKENINNKIYENLDSYPKSEDYKFVEDEEKSIRWNREEKEKINNEYKEAKRKWNEKNNENNRQFGIDVVNAIINNNNYKFNEEQSQKIYDYNYSEHHGYGYLEIINYVEEFVGIYEEIRFLE